MTEKAEKIEKIRCPNSLLRFPPKKSAESRFFTLQTAFRPKVCRTKGTRSPIIGDFSRHQAQKIHRRDRLLVD
jgi:hypothetical protein